MITLDQIQGHWSRDWIKSPGFIDHSTRVHWMQSGKHYADVRVPLKRPNLVGVTSLADLAPQTLAALMQSEGFAGAVTLEGDHCTWVRDINWHGTPEAKDIGHISFDDHGRMIESGVEAEYTELWSHSHDLQHQALRLSGDGFAGVLITIGRRFVLGIDTSDRPATAPILSALQAGDIPSEIAYFFDALYATGTWINGKAIATLATQPLSEGQCVLSLESGSAIWQSIDFKGVQRDVSLSVVPV